MKFALPISLLAGITCVQAFAPSIHKHHVTHFKSDQGTPTLLQMSSSTLPEASSMRVGELKKELESYGMSSKIYLEKSELVEAVEKARAEGKKPRSTSAGSTDSSSSSSSTESREDRLAKEMENCKAMKAGELKKELESYGISTSSFFEKSEFVKACAEARVDGKKKTGGSDEEGFAEYSAADVEVLTDDSAGPRPKGQKQQSQSAGGGNPFGGAAGGNPFGGMGGMGNMADMFGGAAGGGSPFGGGMGGGMGGMADMLKNMGMGGMGGGAPGASPFGGAGGGDAFAQAQKMMQNPKVMEIMAKAQSNPKIMKAMQECMSNPAAFAKYQNDPEVGELMRELQKYM